MNSEDLGAFAPHPLEPGEALRQLKRALRDLQLSERGNGFELRGQTVLDHSVEANFLLVRLARRPARAPEWDRHTLRSAADLRKLLDEIKKRLTRWDRDE